MLQTKLLRGPHPESQWRQSAAGGWCCFVAELQELLETTYGVDPLVAVASEDGLASKPLRTPLCPQLASPQVLQLLVQTLQNFVSLEPRSKPYQHQVGDLVPWFVGMLNGVNEVLSTARLVSTETSPCQSARPVAARASVIVRVFASMGPQGGANQTFQLSKADSVGGSHVQKEFCSPKQPASETYPPLFPSFFQWGRLSRKRQPAEEGNCVLPGLFHDKPHVCSNHLARLVLEPSALQRLSAPNQRPQKQQARVATGFSWLSLPQAS